MRRWLHAHEVRAIRRLRRDGIQVTQLANAFGLTVPKVSTICNRRTCAHVPDDASVPHAWDTMSLEAITRHLQAEKTGVTQQLAPKVGAEADPEPPSASRPIESEDSQYGKYRLKDGHWHHRHQLLFQPDLHQPRGQ